MITEIHLTKLKQAFPNLSHDKGALAQELANSAFFASLDTGLIIAQEGQICEKLPLVLSGGLRVLKMDDSGREITLYRIGPGESCVLTAACMLSRLAFPANAVVEEQTEVVLVPRDAVHDWASRYEPWRELLFQLIAVRLADVIARLDEVAFNRLETRLAKLLLSLASQTMEVRMTHQRLADELGASRETISRLLNTWERQGHIRVARGLLEVRNKASLQHISNGVQLPCQKQ